MDPDNTQWYDRFIDNCFREDGDRRDDFEEPWYWSRPSVPQDSGDYEEPWDDIGRRERMAEAIYES